MNRALAFLALTLFSTPAMAVFDGQIYMGNRSAKFMVSDNGTSQHQTIQSAEKGVAFHFDPVPLAPVSFGMFYAMNDYDMKEAYRAGFDQANPGTSVTMDSNLKGSTFGPEVKLWLPYFDLKPYIRASYAMGAYKLALRADIDRSAGTSEHYYEYNLTGSQVGVGLDWSLVPTISLFIESNMGQYKLALDKANRKEANEADNYYLDYELAESDIDPNFKSHSYTANGFLIGISAGI